MKIVNLSIYNNDWYKSGSTLKKTIWYFTNMFLFKTMLPIPSSIKAKILRFFGANIGVKVVINTKIYFFHQILSHIVFLYILRYFAYLFLLYDISHLFLHLLKIYTKVLVKNAK